MTTLNNDHESRFDALVGDVANDRIDDHQLQKSVDTVWQRIVAEVDSPLAGCDDFQAAIPALVAGTLSEARALLVHDHTRECVPCRRALMRARSVQTQTTAAHSESRPTWKLPSWVRMAAAAVLVVGGSLFAWTSIGNVLADRSLTASVGEVDGMLHLLSDDGSAELVRGTAIRSHQKLRSAKDSSAFLELADGSVIEMDQRSELSLSASRRGTTIDLTRGNIIVHAAPQHGGRLYVATDQCEVSVKGTIFAVNHGLKGSRVSVIEGAVEVAQGKRHELLEPGEQLTTDARLRQVPVEEEIAWSQNAEQHIALMRELSRLNRDLEKAVNVAEARSSTRLLDLAPADTAIYAAIPNLSEGVEAARQVFEARLTESPLLAEWWQKNVVEHGTDVEINEILDRLQPLGRAIGDEIVVAVPAAVASGDDSVVVMSTLDDPDGFRAALANEIERMRAEASPDLSLILVDDLQSATAVANAVYVWTEADLFVATSDLQRLRDMAQLIAASAVSPFASTQLYARLAENYAQGVEWLFGVDLEALISAATTGDVETSDLDVVRQLGLLDATTVVLERHGDNDRVRTDAVLDFAGPRRGVAAWLAAPAAMGSLDFVSPDAVMAVAFVAKDAAQMFDELITAVGTVNQEAAVDLDHFEDEFGFDLRDDLVATLGGEAAFAIDGPMLPTPAWKLVVEIYDPATFNFTVEQAVGKLNLSLAEEGVAPVSLDTTIANNREYRVLSHPETGTTALVYTVVDGYLVAAPSIALIDRAIAFRASGVSLSSSPQLTSLLPNNGFTNCSALSYRNFSALAEAIPSGALDGLSKEGMRLVSDGAVPSLFCIYGLDDRILMSGSGASLFSLASMMSLPMGLGDAEALFGDIEEASEVSSRG